jgi:hypothetical protein
MHNLIERVAASREPRKDKEPHCVQGRGTKDGNRRAEEGEVNEENGGREEKERTGNGSGLNLTIFETY